MLISKPKGCDDKEKAVKLEKFKYQIERLRYYTQTLTASMT